MAHRRRLLLALLILLPVLLASAESSAIDRVMRDKFDEGYADAHEQHASDTRSKAKAVRESLLAMEQNAHERHADQRQRHDAIVQKHRDIMQRRRLLQRMHGENPKPAETATAVDGGASTASSARRKPRDFAALRREHEEMMRDHEERMNAIRMAAQRLREGEADAHDEHDEI